MNSNPQKIQILKTPEFSDNDLVLRVASGSESAFAILHNRYRRKLVNYVNLFVRRADVAEDIAQDAFIKAFRSLREGNYQENGKFVAWLMRIARNLVIDYYRKDSPITSMDNLAADVKLRNIVSDDSPEKLIIRKQQHRHLRMLVEELPKEQKEVVLLRYFIGLSFKEIAEFTDVSINTALGRMRYAIINLKKKSSILEQS